ncbi:uncharacterized protein DUF4249 [Aquimarina sp. MAR_2010_214]|uniref:DUF4249 domain-containing protein n=1 Tax=Aquimarina sp. MAR_2010_214 TaxID=1250026 RepID=UPI000C707B11|nr:DUF4249 domain-containing protein [Aquimarina sp. MAR_2010_214]PKV51795.1 uncharacterized protein DUF4249 [Aquimarina sp. MAR_2010_214]
MKLYILLIIGFIVLGCEDLKEEIKNRPEGEKLVLINGFLSPEEEVIKVQVSKTISVFDEPLQIEQVDLVNTLIIKDAVVTIKNENQDEVELGYSSDNKLYQIASSEFLIEPGKSYTLNVLAEGKEFKATCTIPVMKIQNVSAAIGFRIVDDNLVENLNVSFDDIKGKNNFYILGALFNVINSTEENRSIANFDIERFATDVNGDGLGISANGTIFNTNESLEVTVKVANVDELIYTTLRASFLNRDQTENPFFQPIIPPSNIQGEGGYGVFAGFRLLEKKLTLGPVNP